MSEMRSATGPRRGLRRHEAANYLGVSPSLFDQLIIEKRMPRPIKMRSCSVWDVRQLDEAFDSMTGDDIADNSWDAAIDALRVAPSAKRGPATGRT